MANHRPNGRHIGELDHRATDKNQRQIARLSKIFVKRSTEEVELTKRILDTQNVHTGLLKQIVRLLQRDRGSSNGRSNS